jgi:P27 family predicted phage terminase small subunit
MGARGPRPLPTVIKQARGTARADRVRPDEPAVVPVLSLAAPSWLDADGRKVFRRLARHLQTMRVLSASDLPLLSLLADQWSIYLAASAFLRENGDVYSLRDGDGNLRAVMPFPHVAQRNASAKAIQRLSAEFGLSPSSRTRVGAQLSDKPGVIDPLAAFLEATA